MRKVVFDSEEAWLEARRERITSTDVAAIVGLSPFETPLSVFVAKTQGKEVEVNDAMILGQETQHGIARAYSRIRKQREGVEYEIEHSPHWAFWESDRPEFVASWDAVQNRVELYSTPRVNFDEVLIPSLLEIKSTGSHPDEPYDNWLCQAQWEMFCSGFDQCTVAAACGGSSLKYWDIKRDDEAIEALKQAAEEMLTRIRAKNPPAAVASDASRFGTRALSRLYSSDDGSSVQMSLVELDLIQERQSLKNEIKAMQARCDEYDAALQEKMGLAQCAYLPDGSRIVWENRTRKPYSVEGGPYRHFQWYPPRREGR